MCGISGYFGKNTISPYTIKKTLDLMSVRGPDNQSYFNLESKNDNKLSLLHSRLNIIDLNDRSNQPMKFGDITIIFNGEIYNYLELKKKLQKKGHFFKTKSDTEVLLKCYSEYGLSMNTYLEGMWSYAIYDNQKNKLILSRDRFGEKPLFYSKINDNFFFGSEIKYIKSLSGKNFEPNLKKIIKFCSHGYRSLKENNNTFYKKIYSLEPGNNLVLNNKLDYEFKKYWQIKLKNRSDSEKKSVKNIQNILFNNFEKKFRSDVPLAFCLSGGIDSNSLASIAKNCFNIKLNTFSIIDKNSNYDESENIKYASSKLESNHRNVFLKKNNFLENLKGIINHFDQPVSTISYFVQNLLMKEIGKEGFKVSISGTGSDELFTGYYDHYLLQLSDLKNSIQFDKKLEDWKNYIKPFVRNKYLTNYKLYFKNKNFFKHKYLIKDTSDLLIKKKNRLNHNDKLYSNSALKNRMLNELFKESVPVILECDDSNAMMYSIENRSPFLDQTLAEYTISLPVTNYVNNGYAKYLLRQAVSGIVGDKIRLDREKKGFNANLLSLLDLNSNEFRSFLEQKSLIYEFYEKNKILSFVKRKKTLTNSENQFLFNFINSKIFLEQNA